MESEFYPSTGTYVLFLLTFLVCLLILCLFKGTTMITVHWYIDQYKRQFHGWNSYRRFTRISEHFHLIQLKLLHDILTTNVDTEYGREARLEEIISREDLINHLPITRYQNYEPYIERMIQGEENVLTKFKVDMFSTSSGTTGKPKLIPSSLATVREINDISIICTTHSLPKHSQPRTKMSLPTKIMRVLFPGKRELTPCGIPAGSLSCFIEETNPCAPETAVPEIPLDDISEPDLMYIVLLFALRDPDIPIIHTFTASLLHSAFINMHTSWRKLVHDISTGTIDEELKIPAEVRDKLMRDSYPDPIRARELEREFQAGFDGIAKRIWPNLEVILSVTSGSFKIYGDMVSGGPTKGIPNVSYVYAASEGMVGVNFKPTAPEETPVYMLLPTVVYEFLQTGPLQESRTYFSDQLTPGENYELVITNQCGLYRYATGDVIRFIGYYNQAPVIEFLYRRGQVVNIRGEQVSEEILITSMTMAVEDCTDAALTEFCVAESVALQEMGDISSNTPHYVVFVELSKMIGPETEAKIPLRCDDILRKSSPNYNLHREQGDIGPLKVHLMQQGAFERFRHFLLKKTGGSLTQLKMPRVVSESESLKFLFQERQEELTTV